MHFCARWNRCPIPANAITADRLMWSSNLPTSSACSGGGSCWQRLARAQKHEFGVVVFAAFQSHETLGRRVSCIGSFFDYDKRLGFKPSALACRDKRFFRKALAVRRVEKNERERLERMSEPQFVCVPPEKPRYPPEDTR